MLAASIRSDCSYSNPCVSRDSVWRTVYVIGSVMALYLNMFVLVAQLFQKAPPLRSLAPTQSDLPFLVTQLAMLLTFFVPGRLAVLRFHAQPYQPEASATLSRA